ncbi:hypothetical protein [Apilactobacillus micheneri]|nr:hypothetical protein [Apilactobacillus micheneri]
MKLINKYKIIKNKEMLKIIGGKKENVNRSIFSDIFNGFKNHSI